MNSLVTEAVSKRVSSVQGACQARLAYPLGGGQYPLVASGHRDSAGEAGIRGQSCQRGLETGQVGYGTHNESIPLWWPRLEAAGPLGDCFPVDLGALRSAKGTVLRWRHPDGWSRLKQTSARASSTNANHGSEPRSQRTPSRR